jgi:hypothetical protein
VGKERIFTTLPTRAIGDTSLTALDLRCLAVIALHDGMSAVSGKGAGCFAKNMTLAAEARTDPTNFSKSLSRLIHAGYVSREPQLMDKRRFTLRVQYLPADSWRDDQQSPPQYPHPGAEIVGEPANPKPEIVGDGESKNGSFSKGIGRDYISLNEELHFEESREINSDKLRAFGFSEIDPPEGGLGKESLRALMPRNFDTLPSAAQVAKIETAFAALGRDANRIDDTERSELCNLLFNIEDAFAGEPFAYQAQRLLVEMERY